PEAEQKLLSFWDTYDGRFALRRRQWQGALRPADDYQEWLAPQIVAAPFKVERLHNTQQGSLTPHAPPPPRPCRGVDPPPAPALSRPRNTPRPGGGPTPGAPPGGCGGLSPPGRGRAGGQTPAGPGGPPRPRGEKGRRGARALPGADPPPRGGQTPLDPPAV